MDIGQGDIFLSALYLWYISANITKNTLNRPEICCAWWSSKQVNWARREKRHLTTKFPETLANFIETLCHQISVQVLYFSDHKVHLNSFYFLKNQKCTL